MASFSYLWAHRTRYPWFSRAFFKVWAKRIVRSPELIIRNYRRRKLIRAGAAIAKTAEIGEAVFMGNKSNLSIGAFSSVGKAVFALHERIYVGERVCINDQVEILTASHDIHDSQWSHIKKPIIIQDYAWIGTGAMLLPGVTIGRGAVVGARAVVSKSVPDGAIVVGNPAKIIDKKRNEHLDYNPCAFLAANEAWLGK